MQIFKEYLLCQATKLQKQTVIETQVLLFFCQLGEVLPARMLAVHCISDLYSPDLHKALNIGPLDVCTVIMRVYISFEFNYEILSFETFQWFLSKFQNRAV